MEAWGGGSCDFVSNNEHLAVFGSAWKYLTIQRQRELRKEIARRIINDCPSSIDAIKITVTDNSLISRTISDLFPPGWLRWDPGMAVQAKGHADPYWQAQQPAPPFRHIPTRPDEYQLPETFDPDERGQRLSALCAAHRAWGQRGSLLAQQHFLYQSRRRYERPAESIATGTSGFFSSSNLTIFHVLKYTPLIRSKTGQYTSSQLGWSWMEGIFCEK